MQGSDKLIDSELNSSTCVRRGLHHSIQRHSHFDIQSNFQFLAWGQPVFFTRVGSVQYVSVTCESPLRYRQSKVFKAFSTSLAPFFLRKMRSEKNWVYSCTSWYRMNLENSDLNIWKYLHGNFEAQIHFCSWAYASVPMWSVRVVFRCKQLLFR